MARAIQPAGVTSSQSPSRRHVGFYLPWMCAGLVVFIEAWQRGFGFGLIVGVGGALLVGFVFCGLKLYNEAGVRAGPSLSRNAVFDFIGLGKNEVDIHPSPISWQSANGTAVLRL